MLRLRIPLALYLALVPAFAPAAGDKEEFFEVKVRPLLLERCSKCHDGSDSAKSELSVLSRKSLLEGAEFGPSIIPGRPDESILVQSVRRTHKELKMPPEAEDRLSREEISILAKWISEGAFWPERKAASPGLTNRSQGPDHSGIAFDPDLDWALLPRKPVSPPEVPNPRWRSNPIDQFLEAERIARGITPNRRADRRTLIRRVTFDLTGLPPTPREVADFVNDPADESEAFAAVVDRLLASPHYGQRQGRHWLDVARYADTQGDVGDYPIHTAYLYRNWVIDSFNEDLPFDEFLRAQIAGDRLAVEESDPVKARDLTVATGLISLSRRFGNSKKDSMHLTIEDTLDTVGRGVMGLTLRCARCHDHKFDPVSQEDYYALYGIFESTIYPSMGMSVEKSPSDLSPAIPSPEGRRKAREYWDLIARYEYQINNHFRPWLKPTLAEYKKVCGQMDRTEAPEEMASLEKRRDELLEFKGGKFRELMQHGLQWIKDEKTRVAKNPGMELVFAVGEGKPVDAKLHRRGNPKSPGKTIPRGVPELIPGPELREIAQGSGRLELARWVTDSRHPLTARVIVNRIWQQHFGRGLVGTPDNFGRKGERPSHPELLDWLAERFITDGWSIKKLHRLIVTSETYRLDSVPGDHGLETRDPENRFLWRFSRFRLDAESIRDGMLFVSGQLDRSQPGGHDIKPWYAKRYGLNNPFHQEIDTNHRSIYLLTQRLYRHSQLGLFDAPDRNSSTAQRSSSSVPAQALFLMNSEFVKEQSEALAGRLRESSNGDRDRINELYQHLFGRNPSEGEMREIDSFLESYRESAKEDGREWLGLCRTLLTSNEFFFID